MRIPSISTYVKNTSNTGLLGSMKLGSGGLNRSSMSDMNNIVSQYSEFKANRSQIKAYYKQMNQKDSGSTDSSNAATDTSGLKSKIDAVTDSAGKLTDVGSKSLFKKDASGNYDTKAITDAVSSFVKDYNALNKAASGAEKGSQVAQRSDSMSRITSTYSSVLSKVGITVGSDNSLSFDAEKFKSADMTMVKALFNGTNSYAGMVSNTASQMKGPSFNGKQSLEAMLGYQTYNHQGSANYMTGYMSGSVLDYIG